MEGGGGGSIGRSVTNAGIPMLNRNDRRYWRWNVDGGGGCARRVAGRNTVLNTARAVTDTDGKTEETSHAHISYTLVRSRDVTCFANTVHLYTDYQHLQNTDRLH